MRYKLTFLTGFTAGYVLGTKAGRRRYEQISDMTRRVMGRPEVQRIAETARAEAGEIVETAKRVMSHRVGGQDVTDLVTNGAQQAGAVPGVRV